MLSKAENNTDAKRVKSGAFVGPGQSTLGFGKEKKALLKPAVGKTNAAKAAAAN